MTLMKELNARSDPVGPGVDGFQFVFSLDANSGVPTYLQLAQQIERALRLGYLRLGDRLPRVREVVAALSINPNTVLKAYREVERKGFASGKPGQGTFITGTPNTAAYGLASLKAALVSVWMRDAASAGLDYDDMRTLFRVALDEFIFNDRPNGATQ